MKRVNQYQFYQLATVLHPLSQINQGSKLKDAYYDLRSADAWLDFLIGNNLVPLNVCKPACEALRAAVAKIMEAASAEFTKQDTKAETMVEWIDSYNLRKNLEAFETVYAAEL